MSARWTPAFPLSELPCGSPRLFRHEQLRLAVVRLEDDRVVAIDDRCPHEGYPLVQGTVCGQVLTCCFHNFKFDLTDGRCLMGDEAVTVYPTRLAQGTIEIDLAPPDPAIERARRWRSLSEALREHKTGQLCRDAVRLLALGERPVDIALAAAAHDCAHGEWGNTHALPVAADVLRLLPRFPGLQAASPLAQVLDVAAFGSVRRPPHPVVAAVSAADLVPALRERVEAEDGEGAEAVARGAIAADRFDELEQALLTVASDHFLDYGHGLIYVIKAFDLLRAAEFSRADEVLPGLLRSLVNGTREDMLPKWAGWRTAMADVQGRFERFDQNDGPVPDPAALRSAVLDCRLRQGLEALTQALEEGAAPDAVATELCLAGAERLLRFDPAIDLDPDVQDDWLSVSHVQTFANAVRLAMGRMRGPLRIRLLYQAVRLIAGTRPLDRAEPLVVRPLEGTVDELLLALSQADTPRAVGLAATVPLDQLREALERLALSDEVTRPIVVAHVIKQTVAAFDDAEATDDRLPVLALVAFLAGPRRERRVARQVGEAIRLVRDGRVPKLLALS